MDVSGTGDGDRETVSGSNSCLKIKHGVPISTFDLSVENFLSSMEAISEFCVGNKEETFEVSEIERFKSMVVFMREWKQFYFSEWMPSHCKFKTIDFAYVAEFAEVNHVINGINLPLFSSAAVPKQMDRSPCTESTPDNDDFVLQVGGSVWALDWCPRLRENTGCNVEIEYLAVAAHPPGSEYHKIGEQLSGRGSIQIWCFLHLGNNDEVHISGGARRRGRPKKASHSISSETIKPSNNMENPSAPFTIRGFGSSNDISVSSEFNTNEVPKNSYNAGDLDCSNGTYPHVDNSIKGPRSRGRPIKTPVAKKVRPRGRPKKYPISNSNDCEVFCSDQLLDSFSSTSRDFRSLSGPITPVGCFIDESHKGVNCVSDLNGQEKALPICKSNPHSNVDGLDVPMNSLLPSGSHEMGSTASRPRQRHKKSSVPSENSIIPLSEDLLVLPISRGCEASRGSAVTGKDIEVRPLGGFNDGACDMKSNLQGKKRDVKDGATILYADTNQSVKKNDGVAKGVCDSFSGGKLKTGKKNEFDCYRYFIPESPHIKEVHDSGACVIPIHVDGSVEIAAVIKKSAPKEFFIPTGIALPRLVLSVAHNGKVAWDMKWRPADFTDSKQKHHLGYLAVLLGNGSLEVWEVPVHGIIRLLYATCHTEGTDPRFLKLQPVFRCSRVNFGGRQSIPLTLEWSPSSSRDLILAGCHDGTVALWKFSSQHSFQDTKPLLCFTADTVPIRSLAWAPDESDTECSNTIVTAGHEGLKFWDLRDPYHPMWDFCPVQRAVLGLDWLKNPRCIVIAYEDGTLRTLSVTRAANDMPITGETLSKTKQQGVHFQSCSSFAIWSVQVSRSSGHVAYCSSDGWTRHFQLTEEAVNKDSSRYRKPHLVCGSFVEEGPTIRINTHFTSTPLPEQTFVSKVVNEATPTNSSMLALCWQEDHTIKFNSRQKKRNGNPKRAAEAGEDVDTLQCIQDKGDESRLNIMKFPPKSVALHKVRWNMNKGSGRWLCYGGAAGIVRCQVVSSK